MTQPKGRVTESVKPATDELGITEAAWPVKEAAKPHPALVAKLKESWDAGTDRTTNGVKRRDGKPFALAAKDDKVKAERERQLRVAAESLGYGVSIKSESGENGSYRLIFRARTRRQSRTSE